MKSNTKRCKAACRWFGRFNQTDLGLMLAIHPKWPLIAGGVA
ncbi:hypothetical protein [Frateuria aurantia]|uniref:Uncharacterized protein n=1 Tax=Frateuria aurantia (strain ATCC 33424 / DSM 6220 / KCTC 2777 / LMG 1558 / NBRC 3245 / NCIMB 13370) TaxID=767434 RepID=H8L638_FRAAD|nr:hypothetical protein [Frateuria aurantia]AFC85882.1 hypothetical protein Fraau_1459 [Frateuria aurantia DSM 6220]